MLSQTHLDQLYNTLKTDYASSGFDPGRFQVGFKIGKKYVKVTTGHGGTNRSCWGFIVKEAFGKFRSGDILKAASWNSPALNQARGNVIDGGYCVQWTGPMYLK